MCVCVTDGSALIRSLPVVVLPRRGGHLFRLPSGWGFSPQTGPPKTMWSASLYITDDSASASSGGGGGGEKETYFLFPFSILFSSSFLSTVWLTTLTHLTIVWNGRVQFELASFVLFFFEFFHLFLTSTTPMLFFFWIVVNYFDVVDLWWLYEPKNQMEMMCWLYWNLFFLVYWKDINRIWRAKFLEPIDLRATTSRACRIDLMKMDSIFKQRSAKVCRLIELSQSVCSRAWPAFVYISCQTCARAPYRSGGSVSTSGVLEGAWQTLLWSGCRPSTLVVSRPSATLVWLLICDCVCRRSGPSISRLILVFFLIFYRLLDGGQDGNRSWLHLVGFIGRSCCRPKSKDGSILLFVGGRLGHVVAHLVRLALS